MTNDCREASRASLAKANAVFETKLPKPENGDLGTDWRLDHRACPAGGGPLLIDGTATLKDQPARPRDRSRQRCARGIPSGRSLPWGSDQRGNRATTRLSLPTVKNDQAFARNWPSIEIQGAQPPKHFLPCVGFFDRDSRLTD